MSSCIDNIQHSARYLVGTPYVVAVVSLIVASNDLSLYWGTDLTCSCCKWVIQIVESWGEGMCVLGRMGALGSGRSPAGLPWMSIDISMCLCCSLGESERALCFSLYFIAFYWGIISYRDLLENGDPWWSGDSFSANAKGLRGSPRGADCYRLRWQPLHLPDRHSWPPPACFCLGSHSVSIRTDLEHEQPCIHPLDKNFRSFI